MSGYIDREAIKKRAIAIPLGGKFVEVVPVGEIESLPAADVAPVVHGRWIDDKGNFVPWDETNKNCPRYSAFCSVCGEWLTASDEYPTIGNFCPNCGAKMEGENNG